MGINRLETTNNRLETTDQLTCRVVGPSLWRPSVSSVLTILFDSLAKSFQQETCLVGMRGSFQIFDFSYQFLILIASCKRANTMVFFALSEREFIGFLN